MANETIDKLKDAGYITVTDDSQGIANKVGIPEAFPFEYVKLPDCTFNKDNASNILEIPFDGFLFGRLSTNDFSKSMPFVVAERRAGANYITYNVTYILGGPSAYLSINNKILQCSSQIAIPDDHLILTDLVCVERKM